ncbi:hypothetical protein [Solimonas terrae]|nr:hypothetical protein [Solimonas terrae]
MRASLGTLVAAGLLAVSLAAGAADADSKAQTVRPQVGKPLTEAQADIQAKKYADALTKLDEAAAVEKLTAYESYVIARMRASATLGTGDDAAALIAYKAVLDRPELVGDDKQAVLDTVARLSYAGKDYAKAAEYAKAYRAAGGTDAQMPLILAQALYLSDDYADAEHELLAQFEQMQQAGQTPPELPLRLYMSCAVKQNDKTVYRDALRRLVTYYPSADLWQELITHTVAQPGFSNRLLLDMYRLKAATDTIDNADEYEDAAQLALAAGLPGEAQQYIDQGYAKGLLGAGPRAVKDKSLKAAVTAKITEDKRTQAEGESAAAKLKSGDALINTGLNYVGYGQYDKGIALMQQGIDKGHLKAPDDANLHLGYAQMRAGKTADAAASFKSVSGQDGGASLAQLWMLVKPAR